MDDRRQLNDVLTWLALPLAHQGDTADAARTITPVVSWQRELAARNRGDHWQPKDLAAALYVQGLTDPVKRIALLREASGLMDHLAPEVRATHEAQQWRARIDAAQRSAGAG